MPMPPAWCWWLNCTGCSTNWFAPVTRSDRCNVSTTQPRPSTKQTMVIRLAFDQELALLGNTCDINSCGPRQRVHLSCFLQRPNLSTLRRNQGRNKAPCEKFLKNM